MTGAAAVVNGSCYKLLLRRYLAVFGLIKYDKFQLETNSQGSDCIY